MGSSSWEAIREECSSKIMGAGTFTRIKAKTKWAWENPDRASFCHPRKDL